MRLRHDDVKSAVVSRQIRQPDIGAAPGHVGCYRDPFRLARGRDDFRFRRILSGIQYDMGQPRGGQVRARVRRRRDADSSPTSRQLKDQKVS